MPRPTRAGAAVAAALALAALTSGCSASFDSLPLPLRSAVAEPAPDAVPAAESTAVPAAAVKPAPAPHVAATTVGWGARGGDEWATAQLTNTGTLAGGTTVSFTAFAADGRVLALGTAPAVLVRVGETTAVGARLDVPAYEKIERVSTDVRSTPVARPSAAQSTFTGINVQRSGRRLLGSVTSTATAAVVVTAVCLDGDAIVGGGSTGLLPLNAGGATTFQVDGMVVSSEPDSCSVFAAVRA